MRKFIYADNAATTKLDIEAFEAMKPYLLNEYGNASQPYSFSRSAKKALKESRQIIAECINAKPEEIYFTSGGTESNNWAIKGISNLFGKSEIISSEIEHHAILNSLESVKELQCTIKLLHPNDEGIINPSELKRLLTSKTILVSVMYANNEIGSIQPIQELAAIAHSNKTLIHTDAVQAVGHIKVDVKSLNVDLLSASAHKFNGPKGIGFLYIKSGTNIAPYADGGSQEFGMRAGTENIASIVGMAIALKKNVLEIDKNTAYVKDLEKVFFTELNSERKLDYIRNGGNNRIPGNISLSFRGYDGEALLHRLDLSGICVSTGSACDSVNTNVSHVLSAINLDDEYAKGTIRISLSKDNSVEDVIIIAKELKKIVG